MQYYTGAAKWCLDALTSLITNYSQFRIGNGDMP